MAGRSRKMRCLSDIRSTRELREARRELDFEIRYTERKLSEATSEIFSLDGLLSLVAPPGSVADRAVGGIATAIATVRGILNAIGMLREKRTGRRGLDRDC